MLKSLLSTFTHTYVDGKTNLNKPFSNKTMDRPFTDVVELACSVCIEKIQLSFLMPFCRTFHVLFLEKGFKSGNVHINYYSLLVI